MQQRMGRIVGWLFLVTICGGLAAGSLAPTQATDSHDGQPTVPTIPPSFSLDTLARDTWAYLRSDWATTNSLPWSWRSATCDGGDYANPAEIGLYALSWLAAYDLQRPWSPSWVETQAQVTAVLNQLRGWQTGSQAPQPNGPNAYQSSVFYQWYWVAQDPPVVGAQAEDHLVPSVDNAWLALSLITIREYALARADATLAQKAEAILQDMNFRLWYHPDRRRFTWGAAENPQGGQECDNYSNENRIINFAARALGQLSAEEFRQSLDALEQLPGSYAGLTVQKVSWDGSYLTYAAPALFIREMDTVYGSQVAIPATEAQIAYTQERGYAAWGLSDCFDLACGAYVQQGAPPTVCRCSPETRPGLVAPHASALALITPLASEAIANLRALWAFPCAYDQSYGFRDSVLANPSAPEYGQCSARFSALAKEWTLLAIADHDVGFVWRYFHRAEGVRRAYSEMYGALYLPLVLRPVP